MKRRGVIAVLALIAVGLFLFAATFWLLGGLGCEDADGVDLDTVRCDSDRGRAWVVLQAGLVLALGIALVGGIAWALAAARIGPFAVPALLIVPVFVVVFVIDDVAVGDKPVPRLSNVRVPDPRCQVPCSAGIEVAFAVDRDAEVEFGLGPARYEDIGNRQYATSVGDGPDQAVMDVDAGRHEVAVRGQILNPPDQRGPLPAGDYVLELHVRPRDAGNQQVERRPIRRRVAIQR